MVSRSVRLSVDAIRNVGGLNLARPACAERRESILITLNVTLISSLLHVDELIVSAFVIIEKDLRAIFSFFFFVCFHISEKMCVCHMFIRVFTYLLTYLLTKISLKFCTFYYCSMGIGQLVTR